MVMRGQLDPLVEWMREQGVRRVRLPDGLEVELSGPPPRPAVVDPKAQLVDDRPAPIAQALEDADGAGVCSCGHSWLEHSEAGCFRGCSLDVCTSTSGPEVAS